MKQCEQCGTPMTRDPHYSVRQFETRRFCSLRCRGIVMKPENFVHNRPHTLAARAKLSAAQTGRPSPRRGVQLSQDTRRKISLALRGPKSSLWRGGVSRDIPHRRFRKLQAENRRRARFRGSFTSNEWEVLKAQFNHTCPSCGCSEPDIKLTADHVRPISLGGTNDIANIQPLCQRCNSRKGIKLISFIPTNNL